jgi:DNA-binding response OmpR family regulator
VRDAPPSRRVLVVDDDDDLRHVLALSLREEGYEVRTARDGREAWRLLPRFRPDLIVLDLMMPVTDGRAFRSRQLADGSWAEIPVIVLSAARNLPAEAKALRPAAVIPKPFELDALLAAVGALSDRSG